ncbi:MAG TPA: hypothetical protein VHL79_09755, partial [Ramlibacter sp.]|nr:hypothetical protein [Ramlibacter sp.]
MKLVQDPVLSLVRKARNARLRSVHTNVVLRRRMEQAVISQGVAPGRVRIIHKWAYATAIRATPPDPNGLRSASALNWRFVVGYSGDFGRAHEFNTILDAAELLHGDHRVAFLFISGRATCQLVEEEARRRALSNVQRRPYQPRKLFI